MVKITNFVGFFPLAAASTRSYFGTADYSNNFGRPGFNATFDYVVVGSGPAGLAMAARLAENNTYSVALIEAGGFYEIDAGNLTVVPGYYEQNIGQPLTDWGFKSTPQPELLNKSLPYARGKTLGGSTALNAMIYQRGTNGSHAAWAEAVGDSSYSFESFLPFFQKSANFTPADMKKRFANASVPDPSAIAYVEAGGPLHVTYTNWGTPFGSWAKGAFKEINITEIDDFSSGTLLGSQWCPLTVVPDDQTRGTSEATYLRSAVANGHHNLKVYPHTLAKRIIFSNKTATGVLVESGKVPYQLSAKKEVIISAGAFQTPQLLMVSGIGPQATLKNYSIPVIKNAPGVGQNMWDHVIYNVMYEVDLSTTAQLNNPKLQAQYASAYNTNGTGLLASNGADYLGWEKLPAANRKNLTAAALRDLDSFPADWPDLEYVTLAFNPFPTNPNLSPEKNYVSIAVALITPLSRGSISINSTDTADPPIINLGWLTEPTDVQTSIQAIKRGRDFWAAPSIQGIKLGPEVLPGANVTTDAQIEAYVRETINTVYHASCTCKMGKAEDIMAVIDSQARVYGVSNLRVVDASSLPFLVPGHPQSTLYALAEKIAADIIKAR